MKYGNTNIADLTDGDLVEANHKLNEMLVDLKEKQQHPKFVEKFKNQPVPEINPSFVQLQNELKLEIQKRKINL